MSSLHRYRVVDVFTEHALEGNPLAVFPDASGIDGSRMQAIARELNLSETVFVLPASRPQWAARLRIFTPARELQFAGHPTVGTAFVLLAEGAVQAGTERFFLEEGVGPVPVRVDAGERPLIWLTTPPIEHGPYYSRSACAEALGLAREDLLSVDPQRVSAGNPAVFIPVRDKDAVDRACVDLPALRKIRREGDDSALFVFVFTPTAEGAYSRMFAPEYGVVEDPATGSATGPLASYMLRHGLLADGRDRFVSEQGTKMGRRSLLHVRIHGECGTGGIEVGGHVTPLVEAQMRLG